MTYWLLTVVLALVLAAYAVAAVEAFHGLRYCFRRRVVCRVRPTVPGALMLIRNSEKYERLSLSRSAAPQPGDDRRHE